MRKTTLSLPEATVVSVICFGLFILWSIQAVLSGFPDAKFSDSGNGWMIGLELILATAAVLYLRARNFEISTLYPHPTVRGSLLGVGLFFAAWVVGIIVTAPFYSPENRQVIDFTFSSTSLLSIILLAMVNGAFEEVFLLGVLVRGLRGFGLSLAIGLPLLVRLLYHLYQGPLGMVWVLSVGATLTLSYLVTQRLWPSVFAHTLWDIVPIFLR